MRIVPPLPENYIVGADVYPEPPETKVIAVTVPLVKTAVATAPLPPPPENDGGSAMVIFITVNNVYDPGSTLVLIALCDISSVSII